MSPARTHIVTRWLIAIGLTLIFFALGGCTKKDEIKHNAFWLDGQEKTLRSALLFYAASPDTSAVDGTTYYQNVLMLLSAGLTSGGQHLSGVGDAIQLSLTGVSTGLDDGTYVLVDSAAANGPFQITAGRIQVRNDASTQIQLFSSTSGQMTVSRSGQVYTIDIAGVADGKKLDTHFAGTITSIQKD